jgi:hypothetical protein
VTQLPDVREIKLNFFSDIVLGKISDLNFCLIDPQFMLIYHDFVANIQRTPAVVQTHGYIIYLGRESNFKN